MSDAAAIPTFGAAGENTQSVSTQKVDTTASAGVSHLGAASKGTGQSFNTMEELREREPKLYQAMIEGCMMAFNRQQRWHEQQFKKIMRENNT